MGRQIMADFGYRSGNLSKIQIDPRGGTWGSCDTFQLEECCRRRRCRTTHPVSAKNALPGDSRFRDAIRLARYSETAFFGSAGQKSHLRAPRNVTTSHSPRRIRRDRVNFAAVLPSRSALLHLHDRCFGFPPLPALLGFHTLADLVVIPNAGIAPHVGQALTYQEPRFAGEYTAGHVRPPISYSLRLGKDPPSCACWWLSPHQVHLLQC